MKGKETDNSKSASLPAWVKTGGWVLCVLGLVALLRGCACTTYLIPSSGMEPVLRAGDCILVNKWSYGLRLPGMKWWGYQRWHSSPVHRGDLVVFNDPAGTAEHISRRKVYISQCIGLPGDTLRMDSLFTLTGKDDSLSHNLVIPRRHSAVRVTPQNRTLLCNTLVMHEGRRAEIRQDTLFVDGRPARHCYFTKNYYWVVSRNHLNLSDSRLFGLVPEDHLIGKAVWIWFSKDPYRGIFRGYQWGRFFQRID